MYFIGFDQKFRDDKRMVVALERVSSQKQAKKYSIEAQKSCNIALAEAHGLQIDKHYVESARSAYKNIKRPVFEELKRDIRANKIKLLIIWRMDRLMRNFIKNESFMNLLQKYNVVMLSCTETVDFETADGRKEVRKRAAENQYESERTSERVLSAAEQAARMGNFPKGVIPFGYRRKHNYYNAAPLELDPETSCYMQEAYELIYYQKWSVLQIRAYMRQYGINWKLDTWYGRLSDPIYKGVYVNRVGNEKYSIPNHSPHLVTDEMWDTVNNIIHSRAQDKKYVYPYKKVLFCKTCGSLMIAVPTVKRKRVYFYYYCNRCRKRVNEAKITQMFLQQFNSMIAEQKKEYNIVPLLKEIDRLDDMIEQNDRFYLEGICTKEYWQESKKKYVSKRTSLANRVKSMKRMKAICYENMSRGDQMRWIRKNVELMEFDYSDRSVSLRFCEKEEVISKRIP